MTMVVHRRLGACWVPIGEQRFLPGACLAEERLGACLPLAVCLEVVLAACCPRQLGSSLGAPPLGPCWA